MHVVQTFHKLNVLSSKIFTMKVFIFILVICLLLSHHTLADLSVDADRKGSLTQRMGGFFFSAKNLLLRSIPDIITTLKLNEIAIEAYLLSLYIEAIPQFIKGKLSSYAPLQVAQVFDLLSIPKRDGETPRPPPKAPPLTKDALQKMKERMSEYVDSHLSEDKGEITKIGKILEDARVGQVVSMLLSQGSGLVQEIFHLEMADPSMASSFSAILPMIHGWLRNAIGDSENSMNCLLTHDGIETALTAMLSVIAKESSFASQELLENITPIGAFSGQQFFVEALSLIDVAEFSQILDMVTQFTQHSVDIESTLAGLFLGYVSNSLTDANVNDIKGPEQMTWGLALSLMAIFIYKFVGSLKAPSEVVANFKLSEPFQEDAVSGGSSGWKKIENGEISAILEHLKGLILESTSSSTKISFYENIKDARLKARVSHWIGSFNMLCSWAINILSAYEQQVLPVFTVKNHLPIVFRLLRTMTAFPFELPRVESGGSGKGSSSSTPFSILERKYSTIRNLQAASWMFNVLEELFALEGVFSNPGSEDTVGNNFYPLMLGALPSYFCHLYSSVIASSIETGTSDGGGGANALRGTIEYGKYPFISKSLAPIVYGGGFPNGPVGVPTRSPDVAKLWDFVKSKKAAETSCSHLLKERLLGIYSRFLDIKFTEAAPPSKRIDLFAFLELRRKMAMGWLWNEELNFDIIKDEPPGDDDSSKDDSPPEPPSDKGESGDSNKSPSTGDEDPPVDCSTEDEGDALSDGPREPQLHPLDPRNFARFLRGNSQ